MSRRSADVYPSAPAHSPARVPRVYGDELSLLPPADPVYGYVDVTAAATRHVKRLRAARVKTPDERRVLSSVWRVSRLLYHGWTVVDTGCCRVDQTC